MFFHGRLHVAQVDAEAFGLDDEFLEVLLEEFGFFGLGGGRRRGDDGHGAQADFEKAGVREAGDDFVGGVGIDFEVLAEGADGRKFVAGAELARDDGLGGGVDDLLIDGAAWFEVDVEREHGCTVADSTGAARGICCLEGT